MTARRAFHALWLLAACVFAVHLVSCGQRSSDGAKEVPPSYERAREMPGHVAHLGKQTIVDGAPRTIVCDDCHDLAAHGFESPGSKPCAKCHAPGDAPHHTGAPGLPATCLACHAFTRPAGTPIALPPTCAGCHENLAAIAGAFPSKHAHASHVTAQATCTVCHAPHAAKANANVDCKQCHEKIDARHGSNGVCTTCHAPHAAAKDAATGCAGCHVGATTTLGSPTSLVAPKVKPIGPKVASHEACTTCHTPHAATKKDVAACASCHADHQGTTTESGKGHAQCIGCHAPHDPTGAKASCTSCHLGHTALGAPEVAAHADCTACHDPHAPKKSPAGACTQCHSNVHPKHPSVTPSGALATAGPGCTGCHQPHPPPKAAFTIARACTTCHVKVASNDHGAHAKAKVACEQCHQSHEFTLEKAPGAAFCVRCHSKVEKQVATGHAACAGCHGDDAHAPVTKVACGSCHIKEKTTAPKGHDACGSCHAPHAGTLLIGAIARPTALAVTAAFCTSCHAAKKTAQHATVPGGCANCHRPHGPTGTASPPACITCHAPASLPGLHLVKEHAAKCESCHGGHSAPSATRDTCTGSCHAARKTHQPEAATCQGCHIFGK